MAIATDALPNFKNMEEEIQMLKEQIKKLAYEAERENKEPIGFRPHPKKQGPEFEMEMAVNEWKSFFDAN